jgi:cytosolic carboxypeptidase protein 2/3
VSVRVHSGVTSPFMNPPPFHLTHVAPAREPVYLVTGHHRKYDRVSLSDLAHSDLVFDSPSSVSMSETGPNANYVSPAELMQAKEDGRPASTAGLMFESRFESGNLMRAYRIQEDVYALLLRPDYITNTTVQWYYFAVYNKKKGQRVNFQIINMQKPTSLYQDGMRPLAYSVKDAETVGRGWRRGGEDVCYRSTSGSKKTYTLSFTFSFPHHQDVVFFAHCFPYTYTQLQREISVMVRGKRYVERQVLCKTLSGNEMDILTITDRPSLPAPDARGRSSRPGVFITARVHPGESNSSYVCSGIIQLLLSKDNPRADYLRKHYVFKIIPMLNPDGVIVGNARCNLSGVDLNRLWQAARSKLKKIAPTIAAARDALQEFTRERKVALFVDIHGHSKKRDVFIYGCENSHGKERVFPMMFDSISEMFSYDSCSFAVHRVKETAARVSVRRQYGITNSYTLENSFCGSSKGTLGGAHYDSSHFRIIGVDFCKSLYEYAHEDRWNRMYRRVRAKLFDLPESESGDDEGDYDGSEKGKESTRSKGSRSPSSDGSRSPTLRRKQRSPSPGIPSPGIPSPVASKRGFSPPQQWIATSKISIPPPIGSDGSVSRGAGGGRTLNYQTSRMESDLSATGSGVVVIGGGGSVMQSSVTRLREARRRGWKEEPSPRVVGMHSHVGVALDDVPEVQMTTPSRSYYPHQFHSASAYSSTSGSRREPRIRLPSASAVSDGRITSGSDHGGSGGGGRKGTYTSFLGLLHHHHSLIGGPRRMADVLPPLKPRGQPMMRALPRASMPVSSHSREDVIAVDMLDHKSMELFGKKSGALVDPPGRSMSTGKEEPVTAEQTSMPRRLQSEESFGSDVDLDSPMFAHMKALRVLREARERDRLS